MHVNIRFIFCSFLLAQLVTSLRLIRPRMVSILSWSMLPELSMPPRLVFSNHTTNGRWTELTNLGQVYIAHASYFLRSAPPKCILCCVRTYAATDRAAERATAPSSATRRLEPRQYVYASSSLQVRWFKFQLINPSWKFVGRVPCWWRLAEIVVAGGASGSVTSVHASATKSVSPIRIWPPISFKSTFSAMLVFHDDIGKFIVAFSFSKFTWVIIFFLSQLKMPCKAFVFVSRKKNPTSLEKESWATIYPIVFTGERFPICRGDNVMVPKADKWRPNST